MPIINTKDWDIAIAKNSDPYGKACVDVARRVMEVLDEGGVINTHKLITDADKYVDAGGITGFMAGAVATMVSAYHSRGDEFKKIWNKPYGHENSEGVVNPALVTIDIDKL